MKIIKHGNRALDWTVVVSCDGCGCVMEVGEDDVRWRYSRHDTAPLYLDCECPECAHAVTVGPTGYAPPLVVERLEQARTTRIELDARAEERNRQLLADIAGARRAAQ